MTFCQTVNFQMVVIDSDSSVVEGDSCIVLLSACFLLPRAIAA